MGTNYFLRTNICDCCKRFDEQHIGKQSMGWSFLFNPNFPTKKDWEVAINDPKVEIYNEYRDNINKKDFIDMVEANKGMLDLRKYYEKDPKANYSEFSSVERNERKDPEGYRFSLHSDFS